jgi:hypothetical protein
MKFDRVPGTLTGACPTMVPYDGQLHDSLCLLFKSSLAPQVELELFKQVDSYLSPHIAWEGLDCRKRIILTDPDK